MGGGSELEPGAMLTPTLRLERKIGGGGMGSVWLAHHGGLETKVVVKFIAQALADNAMTVARFRREAAAAAAVKSPHVVQMLDYGVTEHGRPYLVMELLVGRDLGDHLRDRRVLPPHEVVSIIRQVCKALQRAHDLGIIHRDIKPENIFLCDHDDGEIFVKLLDFGIAKAEDRADVTTTGAAVGTPHYMSPEQAIGSKTIDHRTDLWSLGVLAYFLCTGRRPFAGETTGALTLAIFNAPIPRPSDANPQLPRAFDAWFARACARDPGDRFPSARVLANELADALLADIARAAVDIDATSYRFDSEDDAVPAAPTMRVPPSKNANTLESAPTTEKMPDDELPSPRTTAGVASRITAVSGEAERSSHSSPAPPLRSRAPLMIGALVATLLIGGVVWMQRARAPEPAAPAPVVAAPVASSSTPVAATAPLPPEASASVAPAAAPSPSASQSVAPPGKTGKKPPVAPAPPAATAKKPHVDEPDLK